MLSFWPSFGLLVFFLVILLECRAIAGRATLPLGGFLMVFCYGAIGAPLLALLLQQILTPSDASAESMLLMVWLLAPPIEELAKALPVIVLAFLTREARRLSIADLALIGFASGAGFGFVEGNLNALVNGTVPGVTHLAALGLQTGNGGVFFAGHAVATAIVGLAAGIGLRFLPLKIAYAWAPAAFAILWASFDHGLYNWKLLNADSTGTLPNAHLAVELLHIAALKGQLATWLLPLGLIIAQFFEAYLCSKAVGARRDLLLAREWRPWVINEWLVALLRAPLGRAAFGQTLAYFRLRRAFYLAAFEARRDPGDPTWTRHADALEERLKRERSILFDPPPGTWLLPFPVLKTYTAEWAWRMRWVMPFAVLFVLLFLLGPRSLPEWLRQVLYSETFTIAVVTGGLAFAVWRIVLFARQPRPDPLAAEGAAYAGYYTRALLLGCSFVCGLFPAATLLLGWKAFAPGAALLSGYLPGWIAQGGNLQTLLGLGAIGGAVAPDPRPAGEAYRHEIAAADARIRLLALDIEDTTGAAETASPGSGRPLQLDAFLDAMAKLDAERDAQARRQIVLDECERHAGEATVADPAPAAQAVKDEFDRLARELLDVAAKELDAIASLEQAYGRAWAEIMHDLDAHDVLRRRLSVPLRTAWQAQDDIGWAHRVVEATDEGLLPMQLTLLADLQAVATSAKNTRADMVAAGIERIREAAAQYGEQDPFAFAGADHADDDEAALLAEFSSSAPAAEAPAKPFGQRAPQPAETPAQPDDAAGEAEPPESEENRIQKALDQLIDSSKSDERYLETIQHLERSTEALRQPFAPAEAEPQSTAPVVDKLAEASDRAEPRDDLEDLLDAIKRDSGYLDFAKDTPAARSDEERVQPELPEPREEPAEPDAAALHENKPDPIAEPVVASAPDESAGESVEQDETISAPGPESANDALRDTLALELEQPADALATETETAVDQPPADAPFVPAELGEQGEQEKTVSADLPEPGVATPHALPAAEAAEKAVETAPEPVDVAPRVEAAVERAEPQEAALVPTPESAGATPDAPSGAAIADEAVATPESDAPTAAEPARVATPPEAVAERAELNDAVVASAPEPLAKEQATAEPFVLFAEDEAITDAQERQPTATPVTLESGDQLALPLSPDQQEAPRPEEHTSTAETPERIDVETATAAEPRRVAIEPVLPPEHEEPASKAEIRSSLFTRLFQSIRRQSTESKKPTPWDASTPADAKPQQPVLTPRLEDRLAAPQFEQRQPDTETPSGEVTPSKADWLADFAAQKPDLSAARTDDTPLEPIEWPALSRTADGDAPASAPETAALPVETPAADHHRQADAVPVEAEPAEGMASTGDVLPVESKAPFDDVVITSVADETDAAALTISLDDAKAVERDAEDQPLADQPAAVEPEAAVPEEPAQTESDAPVSSQDAKAEAEETRGTDEFASKADRLSYLLTKLEQAIQAKATPPSAPSEAPAPAADPAPSTPMAPAPDQAPQTQSSEAPAQPDEEAPRADHPDETARPLAEPSIVPAQPVAEAQPAANETSPVNASPERKEPTGAHQKPERLSFLSNKLFEATKPESTEPQHADPEQAPAAETAPPADAAAAYPAESEILDLRGPDPLPDPPDEAEPGIMVGPLQRQESEAEGPTPAVLEPLQPARSDTKPVEATEPAPSQRALQPLAKTPDLSPEAASTPPREQSIAPTPRPRPAEPATHFGSRSKPPRPKSGPRDASPTSSAQGRAPKTAPVERPAQPAPAAGPESPATTPKRDWKLARSEPSKPIDTPTVESQKKPDIRVKTGSGALATTDAAPLNSPAATANAPGKYYGPRLAKADDEPGANTPAQQRALGLAESLTQYYAKTGEPQPPMHTTDRATLQRIISNGKLEAPRRRGAAWSMSGMSRRGEVAIRLKPGAEQFIEFVPSNEIFGQMAHYYPRGVGKGSFATHIPAGHLEYFDVTVHEWVPLLRGRE